MNYLLQVSLSMFEGEDAATIAAAAAEAAAAADAAAEAAEAVKRAKLVDKSFNQDQVNAIVAADRRKLVEKYQELEGMYKTALENQNLTKEARGAIRNKVRGCAKDILNQGRDFDE